MNYNLFIIEFKFEFKYIYTLYFIINYEYILKKLFFKYLKCKPRILHFIK